MLAATLGAASAARALVGVIAAPAATVDEALVRLSLVALLGAAGWAWLATLSVVVEAWRGRPVSSRIASTTLRRLVLLCCGVALVAPTGCAWADDDPARGPGLDGLPLPERALGPAHARSARPSTVRAPRTVVVRAGDCLWSLAAADVPAGASARRVTARWHAIHRLNAAVIGPDPDLIHPGQRLDLPPRR